MISSRTATAQPTDARQGSDFARLTREIKDAGLLDRRRGYYATRMTINVLLLAAAGATMVLLGDSW